MFADPRTPGIAYPIDPRVISPSSAPKEIGVMQRLDGVRSGVGQIEYALRAFVCILQGTPPSTETANASQSGLSGALTDIEASIRESLSTIRQITDSF